MMQLDKTLVVLKDDNMLDIIVSTLFVGFMIFVFGGYHKNKSAQREKENEKLDS